MANKIKFKPTTKITFRHGVNNPQENEWGKGLLIVRNERNDSLPENFTAALIEKAVNLAYPNR